MAEFIENLSLAWSGDFETLKKFVNEILQLDCVWTRPGDDRKLFTFGDSSILWRKKKLLLSINGERSNEVRDQIRKLMFGDNLVVCASPLQTQSCKTPKEITTKIEDLKSGQLINSEAIQSLAESISQSTSIISELQKDKIRVNKDECEEEDKQAVITEQEEYSNV